MDKENIIIAVVFLLIVLYVSVILAVYQSSGRLNFTEKCIELGGEAVFNGHHYECLGARNLKDNK